MLNRLIQALRSFLKAEGLFLSCALVDFAARLVTCFGFFQNGLTVGLEQVLKLFDVFHLCNQSYSYGI